MASAVEPMLTLVEIVFPKLALKIRDVVEDLIDALREEGKEMDIEDGFELYRELSEIRRIYQEAFPGSQLPVHLEDIFIQFPLRWLEKIDSLVMGWVEGAVKQDKLMFEWPEGKELGDERHTSSAVDIFRSFNQSIDFLKKLEWQDELQYAKFMTTMSKILGKGIMRYCEELDYWFTHEMSKKTPEQEAAQSQTKQQKWMAMAKEAWSNTAKVEPFQFAREVCTHIFDGLWRYWLTDLATSRALNSIT